ncbi:MAG: hypothetical protein ABIU77_24425 [Ferruginibacter sp.]
MPAKITASTTNNSTGEISVIDVQKTINDYITNVEFYSIDETRNPIHKYHHFDISLDRVKQIIETTPGADVSAIRVNLALNMPEQLNCSGTNSVGNCLSILLCGISEDGSSLLRIGDSILADGFAEFGQHLVETCCVQGNPPKGI